MNVRIAQIKKTTQKLEKWSGACADFFFINFLRNSGDNEYFSEIKRNEENIYSFAYLLIFTVKINFHL